jgi:glycosyltransferase involved in cell wall biosynthesis
MRILVLYTSLPFPASSGAKLRGSAVLEVLLTRHQVTFVSLLSNEDLQTDHSSWNLYAKFAQEPLLVPRGTNEELSPAGKSLKEKLPQPTLGMPHWMAYFDVPGMWNRLAELNLQDFDTVQVRYESMIPYALALKSIAPHLKLVVDLDDILSAIFWRKLIFPKKPSEIRSFVWHFREMVKMYAFESGPLRQLDSVWVCSNADLGKLVRRTGSGRGLVVANVVDSAKLASMPRRVTKPALLFVGDFNYFPNSGAAHFFVSKVWPLIRSRVPEAELWLVGSNSQPEILAWDGTDGIVVTGLVESVSPYLEEAMISIAPLLIGIGTRLKILEALGVGLPVVTTTIGVEGIDAKNGVDLLIADTAEDFANQCIRLLTEPILREQLAASGKSLIKQKYDMSAMADAILGCYERLSQRSQA